MVEVGVEVRKAEAGVRVVSRRVVGEEHRTAEARASASDRALSRVLGRGLICDRGRGRRGTCRSSALADRDTCPVNGAGRVSDAGEEAGASATSNLSCGRETASSPASNSGGRATAAARASTCFGIGRSGRGRPFCRPSRVGRVSIGRDRDPARGHGTFPSLCRGPATGSANAAAAAVTAIASFPCRGPGHAPDRDRVRARAAARVTATVGATGPP